MARTIAIVAAVVVVAGAVYYIWPMQTVAPTTEQEEQTPTGTEQSSVDMSGTWESQTDEKFTREIRTDGILIDRYEGDASAGLNGEWSVVDPTKEGVLSSIASNLTGMTVIKVVWEGGIETTYFSINSLTEDSMTITDLSGTGSITTFVKI